MKISTALAACMLLLVTSCDHPGTKENEQFVLEPPPSADSNSPVHYEDMLKKSSEDQMVVKDKFNSEGYDFIAENDFLEPAEHPLSTFSIDVDEASYSNVRRFLNNNALPPAGAVRVEEMINYFDYTYPQPNGNMPFSVNSELSDCPWNSNHQLLHIGLQGKTIVEDKLPSSNFVFLIDVSGSMEDEDKLPLVKRSLNLLTDRLREEDKVAIVVYAGNAGLVLPSTNGSEKKLIRDAIDELEAGGSTAGGEGIQLAYAVAEKNFIKGGNNRVIIATDGDFNVGVSSEDELVKLIEQQRKGGVYLSVLGFGTGNYQDNKMQLLADKGNGNHSYIDNISEAKKVLVREFSSTLFTIAKDVKIQVEFNPQNVTAYRLVGYENRILAAEDFNDDSKDAGEIGAGHTVTAIYEIIPAGVKNSFKRSVDPLKYQAKPAVARTGNSNELLTIKLRYKEPEADKSMLISKTVGTEKISLGNSSDNFRFSAAVAGFGLLLRDSKFIQQADFKQVKELASSAMGTDVDGYRKEFVSLVETARKLKK